MNELDETISKNESSTDNEGDAKSPDSDSESESEPEDLDRYWPTPKTESLKLVGSSRCKTLTALTIDNAGTRFAAGGHDSEVRIWDFQVLDPHHPTPIGNSQQSGQAVIKSLDFSRNDELILMISESCQAIILGKDGLASKQHECPKGDQYISDMSKTKGHVQMLNDGSWSPKEQHNFITCSNDGTVRIWDLNKMNEQRNVIKTRSPITGIKANPTVCKYSRDALSIVAGCTDGSIMMWDTRRKFLSTSICIKSAHLKGSEVTGIDFSYSSSNKICTRSEDESCKIWDTRQLKQALCTRTGLPTIYTATDCSFSPDDKLILAGCSATESASGRLLFLDASSSELGIKDEIVVEEGSVIRSRWHPRINHIAFTCSTGALHITYDREKSQGGLLIAKAPKRKKYVSQTSFGSTVKKIITPHALPLFREDSTSAKARSYKPNLPPPGVSQAGLVKPAGSTLSSYIARNIAKPTDDGTMNIRERVLRHAEEAERDPQWIKPDTTKKHPTERSEK